MGLQYLLLFRFLIQHPVLAFYIDVCIAVWAQGEIRFVVLLYVGSFGYVLRAPSGEGGRQVTSKNATWFSWQGSHGKVLMAWFFRSRRLDAQCPPWSLINYFSSTKRGSAV